MSIEPFYCGECGEPCDPVRDEDSIGSDCCDAIVYTDKDCTHEYDIHEYDVDRADYMGDELYNEMIAGGFV